MQATSKKDRKLRILTLLPPKADDKIFCLQIFQKMLFLVNASYIILRIQRLIERAKSVDLDEMAHYEPPHQGLRCLQIQLFSSLVLKE